MDIRLRFEPFLALVALSLAGFGLIPVEAIGQEDPGDVHTFSGPNGTTLEAEVLSMDGGTISIRRLSDGQEFQLQANQLAPQDVTFMRAWLAAKEASVHPLGWKRLRVAVPEFADRVEAPGIPAAFRRIDRHVWEAELPSEAWVLVSLVREEGADFAPEFLLPRGEEREWHLTFDGKNLHRAFGAGGAPVLTGISIGADIDESDLRGLKSKIPGSGVSLFAGFLDAADLSALRGSNLLSLVVGKLPDFSVAREGKVRALRITSTMGELTGLGGWEEVEYLEFPVTGDFPMDECGRLNGLTTLITDGDVSLEPEGNDAFPALRFLSLRQSDLEGSGMMPHFLAAFPNLQSLALPDYHEVDLAGFAECPDLTAIEVGNDCLDPGAAGVGSLGKLTIALLNDAYASADLNGLADKGVLGKLRTLGIASPFDLNKTPQLKKLRWLGSGEEMSSFGQMTGVSILPALEVRNASVADLEAIRGLGAQLTNLKSVSFKFPNTDTLAPVGALPAVEWLSVSDQLVTFEQKVTALDASSFPALRGLELARLQNLAEFTFSAPKIEAVSVRSCDALSEVKGGASDSLEEVVIVNAKNLRKTNGLLKSPALSIKRITGSPAAGE